MTYKSVLDKTEHPNGLVEYRVNGVQIRDDLVEMIQHAESYAWSSFLRFSQGVNPPDEEMRQLTFNVYKAGFMACMEWFKDFRDSTYDS